jgi:hypothetical protein
MFRKVNFAVFCLWDIKVRAEKVRNKRHGPHLSFHCGAEFVLMCILKRLIIMLDFRLMMANACE